MPEAWSFDKRLHPQATIEYPNGLFVSYEPLIKKNADESLMRLCLAEKDYEGTQWKRTPDVVLFKPGDIPKAVVLDAKYVGAGRIEGEVFRSTKGTDDSPTKIILFGVKCSQYIRTRTFGPTMPVTVTLQCGQAPQ